ncbi:MAG: hypothetical protein HY952_01660 [Elusimicrobia bacterium]|nr:hypothetical protein [Elusimicrobiota bacterium]
MKNKPPRLLERLSLPSCPVGRLGNCCKGCFMGPCRLAGPPAKGVCGASHELITAKNLLRTLAAGAAAHCGQAARLGEYLGKKLPAAYLARKAPAYLYRAWRSAGLLPAPGPSSCFREISEAMHASAMGVNSDWGDLVKWCLKMAILDGYYGLHAATALEDGKFGKPEAREGALNLACLSARKVNIAVHGHEPAMVEAIAGEARRHAGVNLVGVCCTGATFLSAHGIPLAAHFTLQEEVIASGLVEALVVDSQCILPSLSDLCECYHTRLITTNPLARMPGAVHLPITDARSARRAAKRAIELALRNRSARKPGYEAAFGENRQPPARVVIGSSEENVDVPGIAAKLRRGGLKGVIAVVGCVNPRSEAAGWVDAFTELSRDYLILTTGCMAFELGSHGLLDGKRALHLGSCVNNARIADIFGRLAELCGRRISSMPLLVSCPMPITEKSAAIGFYFAALGCAAHFGGPFPVAPGTATAGALGALLKNECGGELLLEADPRVFREKVAKTLLPAFWGRERARRGCGRAGTGP